MKNAEAASKAAQSHINATSKPPQSYLKARGVGGDLKSDDYYSPIVPIRNYQ
jgi:hypothetical protein